MSVTSGVSIVAVVETNGVVVAVSDTAVCGAMRRIVPDAAAL